MGAFHVFTVFFPCLPLDSSIHLSLEKYKFARFGRDVTLPGIFILRFERESF